MLSEQILNPELYYHKINTFENDQNNSDLKDESQEYHCITCNRTYDGLIKCRHGSENN